MNSKYPARLQTKTLDFIVMAPKLYSINIMSMDLSKYVFITY